MAQVDQADGQSLPGNVRSWRLDQLVEAGYPQEEAFILARRLDVDLHAAIALLQSGCSVETAVRILT